MCYPIYAYKYRLGDSSSMPLSFFFSNVVTQNILKD